MAPPYLQPFFFLLVLSASILVPSPAYTTSSPSIEPFLGRRVLLEKNPDDDVQVHAQLPVKKKLGTTPTALGTTLSPTKAQNKTKLIKPANSTKLTKPTSPKNQTISKNSTKDSSFQEKQITKINLKKLNSTKPTSKTTIPAKPTSKITNSTKPSLLLTQKSTDQTKQSKLQTQKVDKKSTKTPSWSNRDDDEEDLVSEFRDLPSRFQETLLPDLEVISTTSKAYLNKANKQMTQGFKPFVGHKYAPTVASMVSFLFILIPFLLVSLIFNQIKAYFSLQKLIIFIQIYLSIYFSILCLSALVTGLEPLKFFYATSRSTYVCVQLLQTLAYVLYLLLLLMYLVLVFSTETGAAAKGLALGQAFVGFAVGLHYYVTVFHRAVLRQPPKSSWRVHAIYATCFLVICLLGRVERGKKAYVVEGSEEEGKKS